MGKHYETQLPANYREAFVVDAKDRKVGLLLNLAALVITAAILAIAWACIRPQNYFREYSLVRDLCFLLALIAYLVLHELAHGAAYHALTHQKLRFGISPSAAFCGVPDIYVYRRTALISLLTPFVLFIPVFLIPAFLLPNAWNKIYVLFLFAMHIGGCSGDLYDTALYLFKFKDPATLMQDTGPKQTFYTPG